jgi:hypothetical protein
MLTSGVIGTGLTAEALEGVGIVGEGGKKVEVEVGWDAEGSGWLSAGSSLKLAYLISISLFLRSHCVP